MSQRLAAGHSDGVDRSQIQRLLALTPTERIRHMVDVVKGMAHFRAHAGYAERRTFEPDPLLHVLNRHGVAYVIVGGLAAVATVHRCPPRMSRSRPHAIARTSIVSATRCATQVSRRRVTAPSSRRSRRCAISSRILGDIDLTIAPTGFPRGYDDSIDDAIAVDLGDGVMTRIASLDDVITSKRAAGRAKDLAALPYLESLRQEAERGNA